MKYNSPAHSRSDNSCFVLRENLLQKRESASPHDHPLLRPPLHPPPSTLYSLLFSSSLLLFSRPRLFSSTHTRICVYTFASTCTSAWSMTRAITFLNYVTRYLRRSYLRYFTRLYAYIVHLFTLLLSHSDTTTRFVNRALSPSIIPLTPQSASYMPAPAYSQSISDYYLTLSLVVYTCNYPLGAHGSSSQGYRDHHPRRGKEAKLNPIQILQARRDRIFS